MALFQPTNIIPSSFTVGVVDALQDVAQISWQVNGNSAMTAYQIDFYTYITQDNGDVSISKISGAGTGKITSGIPTGGFYGTDRFGQPRMFTWTAYSDKTWNGHSSSFINGKQFMFKITQYWNEGGKEESITTSDFNVFNARSTPQVAIFLSDSTFQQKEGDEALEDGAILKTSIGYFLAKYTQEDGYPVRNARWQIATAKFFNNQWQMVDIISDTGEVPTPTLQFEFNGFFNEGMYAVRCLVESESGQQAVNPISQNDGWIFFSIDIGTQGEFKGDFTMQCLSKENAALLEWTSDEIPPVVRGNYELGNGDVTLEQNSSIQWGKDSGFSSPWTVAIGLSLKTTETFHTTVTMALPGLSSITKTYQAKGLIKRAVATGAGKTYRTVISSDKKSCNVTFDLTPFDVYATIKLSETPFQPCGELAKIDMGGSYITINGTQTSERSYRLSVNGTEINLDDVTAEKIILVLTGTEIIVYSGGNKFTTQPSSYTQRAIKNIQISGGSTGAAFQSVTVYQGDIADETLDGLYSDENFKPLWSADSYKLYMTANFEGDINGGEAAKLRIYRQELGQNSLYPIFFSANGNVLKLKDYGIVSRKSYTYWLYEYDKNDGYLKGAQCKIPGSNEVAVISTCFSSYSLLVCDYDSTNDAYHVRKQYLFALNLAAGSVGNNNSPSLTANFTPYPTRMPSTQNYASGTLQGLIGAIYTVPALVEQIGDAKHTVRPSTLDYFDSVDLEKELYDLSVTPYILFLRDMKGHLRMVATNNQISMTPDLKKKQLPSSISFPWVEIGDASDVTVIQTPGDGEWGNDEQALDIRLDMDPATGLFAANYPNPYAGTKFYLEGIKSNGKGG